MLTLGFCRTSKEEMTSISEQPCYTLINYPIENDPAPESKLKEDLGMNISCYWSHMNITLIFFIKNFMASFYGCDSTASTRVERRSAPRGGSLPLFTTLAKFPELEILSRPTHLIDIGKIKKTESTLEPPRVLNTWWGVPTAACLLYHP